MAKKSESPESIAPLETNSPLQRARPARPSRGPQPAHSRARIAEAAVKIADADGIDAASMRRVAAEIGSRATSLYRYVRNKDEPTLRALDGHGLDIDAMLVIANTLSTFARGYAAGEIAEQQAEARSGLGRERWMETQGQYVEMIRGSGQFPLFMRVVDDAKAPHDPHLMQEGFEQGLQCLLDGIAARLA
jgi:AcrR family transcriptional regulator